jgi:predicted nucleotidyltransferase
VRGELRRIQARLHATSVNETLKIVLHPGVRTAQACSSRHREAIRLILEKHGLGDLVAFGSRARGDSRDDSDRNLAVRRIDKSNPLAILAAENDLETLFEIPVDTVERPNACLDSTIAAEGVHFAS